MIRGTRGETERERERERERARRERYYFYIRTLGIYITRRSR